MKCCDIKLPDIFKNQLDSKRVLLFFYNNNIKPSVGKFLKNGFWLLSYDEFLNSEIINNCCILKYQFALILSYKENCKRLFISSTVYVDNSNVECGPFISADLLIQNRNSLKLIGNNYNIENYNYDVSFKLYSNVYHVIIKSYDILNGCVFDLRLPDNTFNLDLSFVSENILNGKNSLISFSVFNSDVINNYKVSYLYYEFTLDFNALFISLFGIDVERFDSLFLLELTSVSGRICIEKGLPKELGFDDFSVWHFSNNDFKDKNYKIKVFVLDDIHKMQFKVKLYKLNNEKSVESGVFTYNDGFVKEFLSNEYYQGKYFNFGRCVHCPIFHKCGFLLGYKSSKKYNSILKFI